MFDRKTNTFTTLDGTEIKIKKIRAFKIQVLSSQIRERYIDNDEPLDPPHYYVDIVGGKQQRHYHNQKSIYKEVEEKLSPEEKAKGVKPKVQKVYKDNLDRSVIDTWEAYLDAVERLEEDIAISNIHLILQDGTIFELPEGNEWIEDQKNLGFKIPDNHKALKAHYLITEVLEDDETKELAELIMKLSNSAMEQQFQEADAISESFRDPVEK